ncbi:MAG: hypothetical protein WCW56_02845 [Candidatus Paceibacterota bacterium]|jgi:hypothetical protein
MDDKVLEQFRTNLEHLASLGSIPRESLDVLMVLATALAQDYYQEGRKAQRADLIKEAEEFSDRH